MVIKQWVWWGMLIVWGGGVALADELPTDRVSFETFGEAHRFLFMAVLEGYYEDGVSHADVARILRREEGKGYDHFIYACPICTAVQQASELYANRPELSMYKPPSYQVKEATFGTGLSTELSAGLASESVEIRLKTIFQLVNTWVNRKLERSRLSDTERSQLMAEMEAGKALGIRRLAGYKKAADEAILDSSAPGFATLDACAMCNGATNSAFQGLEPKGLGAPSSSSLVKK